MAISLPPLGRNRFDGRLNAQRHGIALPRRQGSHQQGGAIIAYGFKQQCRALPVKVFPADGAHFPIFLHGHGNVVKQLVLLQVLNKISDAGVTDSTGSFRGSGHDVTPFP
ncbi:MAG: hypothetical protein A3H27_11530 [Acidobacteria bacterium RIFCSPLOWO2_02_FULL_59_13]|nr:MAG: hypothetical protein A3H27_11530 [Acidobacteria bacterium RIFCSPLOWO2_02_FULL_59_13]